MTDTVQSQATLPEPAAPARLARGVLLRNQAAGVAIGPPLTVEPVQLEEIGAAVKSGLDAVLTVKV